MVAISFSSLLIGVNSNDSYHCHDRHHHFQHSLNGALDSALLELSNGVQCVQLPASTSKKTQIAYSTEHYSVKLNKFAMCMLPGNVMHDDVWPTSSGKQ